MHGQSAQHLQSGQPNARHRPLRRWAFGQTDDERWLHLIGYCILFCHQKHCGRGLASTSSSRGRKSTVGSTESLDKTCERYSRHNDFIRARQTGTIVDEAKVLGGYPPILCQTTTNVYARQCQQGGISSCHTLARKQTRFKANLSQGTAGVQLCVNLLSQTLASSLMAQRELIWKFSAKIHSVLGVCVSNDTVWAEEIEGVTQHSSWTTHAVSALVVPALVVPSRVLSCGCGAETVALPSPPSWHLLCLCEDPLLTLTSQRRFDFPGNLTGS
ncbi:unnamed protein product [Pleuronectes platessa]|uniref:Uncharacterized protein n=1 Tax=Pleuronectes platessa TaxID=8262 RepID=A0A9N7YSF0_PLEPL|nr:unnamed protein product [Pleuronectes platessa]